MTGPAAVIRALCRERDTVPDRSYPALAHKIDRSLKDAMRAQAQAQARARAKRWWHS